MQVRLSLRRSGAVLSYAIPLWYRALAVLIVAVICLAIVGAGGTGVPGWILLGLAVFAALYEERWVFDTATGSCRCRMGLLFANRGPSFTFGDVEVVRLDVFVKGTLDQGVRPESDKMPLGSQVRLIIDTKDGASYMVDSVPYKRRALLEASALEIAEAMGARLET